MTKSSPPDLLISAVRDVAEGRVAICPEITEVLALDRVQEEKTGLEGLSPREFEIFRMILDASSTDEIASALNVSRKTVANYHYASSRSSAWPPISNCSMSACGKGWSGPFPRRAQDIGRNTARAPLTTRPQHGCARCAAI